MALICGLVELCCVCFNISDALLLESQGPVVSFRFVLFFFLKRPEQLFEIRNNAASRLECCCPAVEAEQNCVT